MRNVLRIVCGLTGLIGALILVGRVHHERQAFAGWRRELPANEVSRYAPLEATIADLYRAPPPPGRRVVLSRGVVVRDTIFTERPVLVLDSVVRQPEALIFLSDSTTGDRLVLLRRLDVRGPEWVELMPMPHSAGRNGGMRRWTPLAHLDYIWLPGWAEANGPGALVWLALDSAILRYRDLAGPGCNPPYRLRPEAIAGRPGGPSRPEPFSLGTVAWSALVVVLGVIALFAGSRGLQRP